MAFLVLIGTKKNENIEIVVTLPVFGLCTIWQLDSNKCVFPPALALVARSSCLTDQQPRPALQTRYSRTQSWPPKDRTRRWVTPPLPAITTITTPSAILDRRPGRPGARAGPAAGRAARQEEGRGPRTRPGRRRLRDQRRRPGRRRRRRPRQTPGPQGQGDSQGSRADQH